VLFGQQDDLAGVHFHVADDFEDGFEDGGVTPGAVGLGVDDDEQPCRIEGSDDAGGLVDGGIETGARFAGGNGDGERKFCVTLADVGLVVDAVEEPLAHVAF